MESLAIHDTTLHYLVERIKNRKTIQLALLEDGSFRLRIPYLLRKTDIDQLLANKADWMYKQWTKQQALARNPVNHCLTAAAPLLYLGQTYTYQPREASRDQVYLDGDELIVQYKPRKDQPPLLIAEKLLFDWYTNQAGSTLWTRTAHWAKQIGVSPSRVTIRDQKTRWGSCSSTGSINYSWRLIMAPSTVIDYLIVHELCHILQANHSKAFWELVAHFIPDYAQQRHWLKSNGNLLMRLKFSSL